MQRYLCRTMLPMNLRRAALTMRRRRSLEEDRFIRLAVPTQPAGSGHSVPPTEKRLVMLANALLPEHSAVVSRSKNFDIGSLADISDTQGDSPNNQKTFPIIKPSPETFNDSVSKKLYAGFEYVQAVLRVSVVSRNNQQNAPGREDAELMSEVKFRFALCSTCPRADFLQKKNCSV